MGFSGAGDWVLTPSYGGCRGVWHRDVGMFRFFNSGSPAILNPEGWGFTATWIKDMNLLLWARFSRTMIPLRTNFLKADRI